MLTSANVITASVRNKMVLYEKSPKLEFTHREISLFKPNVTALIDTM